MIYIVHGLHTVCSGDIMNTEWKIRCIIIAGEKSTTTTDKSYSKSNPSENVILIAWCVCLEFPCEKSFDNGVVGILWVFVRLLRNIPHIVAPHFHASEIISIIVMCSFIVSLVENAVACESQIYIISDQLFNDAYKFVGDSLFIM